MQRKVAVASRAIVLSLCAGLVGWQAWSIGLMREQIADLQQQVADSSGSLLPDGGTQVQPPFSPLGGDGLKSVPHSNWFNDQNDPFVEFGRLQARMLDQVQQFMGSNTPGSLFDENFLDGDAFAFASGLHGQEPELDLRESDDAYVITIDIPDDSNAEVSASVDGSELHIEAEITVENDGSTKHATFMRSESRRFARSMPLPADADPDGLTNVTENGQVVITIPKHA